MTDSAFSSGGGGKKQLSRVALWGALGVGAACSATPTFAPTDDPVPVPSGSGGSGGGPSFSAGKGGSTGFDDSPVVHAPHALPPISGGTLLALKSGGRVLVADSDRDRIQLVTLESQSIDSTITLATGSEPGRAAEDGAGRVHVALRGSGKLVTVDTAENLLIDARDVCNSPRGVAYDAANDSILVACLEGLLVELPAAGGKATRVTRVETDARDVVVLGDRVAVTLFREAAVLILNQERQVERRVTIPELSGKAANAAWRAVPAPDGKVAVLHQRSFSGMINVIDDPPSAGGTGGTGTRIPTDGGMGGEGAAGDAPNEITLGHDGYGSVEPCGAVVVAAVSVVAPNGDVTIGTNFDRGVLPVDIALGRDGTFATAFAGTEQSLNVFEMSFLSHADLCASGSGLSAGSVVAVAYDPGSGAIVEQVREPAALRIWQPLSDVQDTIPLDGESVADTGHDLFHLDAGSGLACGSCHPEGTDDGRVWNFSSSGQRRTQPLDVGLFGTAPFHWDGNLESFGALMNSIFTDRMGGPQESTARVAALEEYLYTLPRRPAVRASNDEAALRGKEIFESREVGCKNCHAGDNFSDGNSADIGREVALQVPSLVAVSTRAPYMHDGCAATLLERFDPECGGAKHGNVSALSQAELTDLVAYLETL